MVFNKITLFAAGALATTSVVMAERDMPASIGTHSIATSPGPSGSFVNLASAIPLAIPNTLGRPHHSDTLVKPAASEETIVPRIAEHALPSLIPSRDRILDSLSVDSDTPAQREALLTIGIDELEAPKPDWGTLSSIQGPRFPDLGPIPLTPASPSSDAEDIAPEISDTVTGPRLKTFSAKPDESLEALLVRAGVKKDDRYPTLIALRADSEDDALEEGDQIDVAFARDDDTLLGIRLRQSGRPPLDLRWDGETKPLWLSRTLSDSDYAEIDDPEIDETDPLLETAALTDPTDDLTTPADRGTLQKNSALITGEITSSLWSAADKAGLGSADAKRMADLFRYIVDFERDLRKGDRFEALFEKTEDGYGDILYAKLTNKGSEIALYRGQDEFGDTGYFDASGKTNLRSIMRTPVSRYRVSSHFGMRRHPILGYDKMHRGVDFSAPTGTPIFAAGGGVVEYVGRRGTYGKYIRIRHNSTFKTAYAHLSRYATGLKSGKRVRQGDVIGYVGSTGRSTGPHLHFEIIQDGARVNPMKVADFGPEKVLSGPELSRFKAKLAQIEIAIGLMREGTRVASAD